MARAERKSGNIPLNKSGISYGELIRQCRRKKGISQEELGSRVSVGKNAVGAWEAGRSRPDLSSVPEICEVLGISFSEFFGSEPVCRGEESEAHRTKKEKSYIHSFEERFSILNEYHRRLILKEMDLLIEMQRMENKPVRKLIRIYRNDLSACAGPSLGIGDDAGEAIWLYADSIPDHADEIIRVSGDSMEPKYHDGDQVFIRHTSEIRPGETGIFIIGDCGYIKQFRTDGLRSFNPAYPVMRFPDEEDVRCVGRVIGIVREDMLASAGDVERYTAEITKG